MKEIYTGFTGRRPKIILKGKYLKYKYYITSCGSHPCCYIKLPKCSLFYNRLQDLDDEIQVHGGVTYTGKDISHVRLIKENSCYFGWDYAHYGDYKYIDENTIFGGKKYTIYDLLWDVIDVCEQLKHYEK